MVGSYFVGFSALPAWVFNDSGESAWLAMLMHGADNATQGRLPIDLSIVPLEGVLLPSTLATIDVPHTLPTWVVALVGGGVVGTALYGLSRFHCIHQWKPDYENRSELTSSPR